MERKHGWSGLLIAILCLCLCCLSLAESGVETDEEGGVWNWDTGIYTDPTGQQHPIESDGSGSSGSPSSGSSSDVTPTGSGSTVTNPDGSITIDTGEADDVTVNEDGSITVESGQIVIDDPALESAPLTQEEWEQRKARAALLNGAYTATVFRDAAGKLYDVTVVYMGIGRSMIELGGKQMLVNTVDLDWETEAPEDKVLAVIDTPGQGYARLYAGPGKKTTLLAQCRMDKVVRVIRTGDRWTLIDFEGTRGYVQTKSLEFFANDHREFTPAVLSVNGKTTGRNPTNIRSRDKKCRILADYNPGTPLTVFDIIDEWAEVDVEGWHCRILSKFVTPDRPETVSLSAAD